MRKLASCLLGCALAGAVASAAAAAGKNDDGQKHGHEHAQREAGAHAHGHGSLNIAVEGSRLMIELIAPGSDIAGIEYAPKSAEDKARVAAAKAKLGDAVSLFGPSPAAGCKVDASDVEFELHGQGHAEFHATWELSCNSIASLKELQLKYFDSFAGAQELAVQVITGSGQAQQEASRGKPVVALPK